MDEAHIWALAIKAGMRQESWMTNPPMFAGLWTEKASVYAFAAAIRTAALEEAAKVCESLDGKWGASREGLNWIQVPAEARELGWIEGREQAAASIRALIESPATPESRR
jgi:hypothetical protein